MSVLPATPSDTWITDGLTRYSEALYAEQSDGIAGLHKALEDFAVGALMYEDTTPISQAGALGPLFRRVLSIVADKGAMVFTCCAGNSVTIISQPFSANSINSTREA